jgi:hypothetical protein
MEDNIMKTKGLIFISCLAAGALTAWPSLGEPEKKSEHASMSKPKRIAPQTTSYRYGQNRQKAMSSRPGNTCYYAGPTHTGTRSYASRQYGGNTYYGGSGCYYGGASTYPYYSYYSGGPYSNWGYGTSWGYNPYSYRGGYPYSGYNNSYSYYTPTYGYSASLVAAVQQRLGQLGYYHGVVDGIIGPRTRNAIAAFESRNGLVVNGRISRPLLDTLRLG